MPAVCAGVCIPYLFTQMPVQNVTNQIMKCLLTRTPPGPGRDNERAMTMTRWIRPVHTWSPDRTGPQPKTAIASRSAHINRHNDALHPTRNRCTQDALGSDVSPPAALAWPKFVAVNDTAKGLFSTNSPASSSCVQRRRRRPLSKHLNLAQAMAIFPRKPSA